MRSVALIATGASDRESAVGARIGAFASGLSDLGWEIQVIDVALCRLSRYQDLVEKKIPVRLRAILNASGCEGDVMPSVWWQVRRRMRAVDADIAVVSVPPFSLLAAVTLLPRRIPLILDYRDPWSARTHPHPLGRVSRWIEGLAVRRAEAITFAGHAKLGEIISMTLGVPGERLVAVANGLNPEDFDGIEPHKVDLARNGTPLDLVFVGHWYGRNGPGILVEALDRVGTEIARLTTIGSISPDIEKALSVASGGKYVIERSRSRAEVYRRIVQADAAIVTMDYTSAVESRIPAKIYDYIGVGVPVIAVCPPESALLTLREASTFHHVDHRDVDGLARLLHEAAIDRTRMKCSLVDWEQYSRDVGVNVLHNALSAVLRNTGWR
jgi:Glycosyl transferase 4-like domain